MNILVTGGYGFIGSCFVLKQIAKGNFVVNLDKLTYAANLDNLKEAENNPSYQFVKGDICDENLVLETLTKYNINVVVNFAAESHVDNSISGPKVFLETNIMGTFALLQASLKYQNQTGSQLRFVHISTDEVYGSLSENDPKFDENSNYQPNSPYSSSKASSDHLVRAWHHTYALDTITTHCSNNFGPRQHHEKLIPHIIKQALAGNDLPIYGNGKNIRDWIFVEDHCYGIELAMEKGKSGFAYSFGGDNEIRNIDIVHKICEILDRLKPKSTSYKEQIAFVEDRKGHDYRYAINNDFVKKELGFKISKNFDDRLEETILWYLNSFAK